MTYNNLFPYSSDLDKNDFKKLFFFSYIELLRKNFFVVLKHIIDLKLMADILNPFKVSILILIIPSKIFLPVKYGFIQILAE